MKTQNVIKPFFVVLAVSSLLACSESNNPPADQSVDLDFAAKVAGNAFTCGDTYSSIGSAVSDYKVTDYRIYISDVHVHSNGTEYPVTLDQDGVWQLDEVVLLDFENSSDNATDCSDSTPETNTKVLGTIDGSIDLSNVQVCFTVGVPFDKNHSDASLAPPPMNAPGMAWPWKVGRKYIRIDGIANPASMSPNPFNLHLGAQGDCGTGASTESPTQQCTYPNSFEVCIDNMDMNADVIDVDVADVLEASDLTVNNGMAAGCQSFVMDDDCVEVFPRLELDYSAYGSPSFTTTTPLAQKLFSKQ